VAAVSRLDVAEFARRYHYTGVAHTQASNWRWGLWHGPVLLGVVAYNLPSSTVCTSVFGPEHAQSVWHMSRLALADSCPRNSESRLIGGSLRGIEHDYPHVWAVVTYAATSAGHIGYVYQATNAIYTGTGGHLGYYVDAQGRHRAERQDGRHVSRTEATNRGWRYQQSGVKHRYVYILGNKTERRARRKLLKLPVSPYPKAGAA
jgi:hypothetical protein